MSFDVFIQCYGETERVGLSRDSVRSLFPVVESDSQTGYWRVQYAPDDSCDFYIGSDESDAARLRHFMVSRPCGDERFWMALISVLQMGSVMMYWPGSPVMVAAGTRALGLPEGMVEDLGGPVPIHSTDEIFKLLSET